VFERIVAPQPRVPAESTPPLLASVVCHVAIAAFAMGVLAHAASNPADDDERTEHAVRALLPLLPSSAPPDQTTLTWTGGTSIGGGESRPRDGEGRGLGTRRGTGRTRTRTVPGAELGPPDAGGIQEVYAFDAELDHPVARHPLAGSPEYPPELLARGVEGHVVAEFTVDAEGRADSSSLVIAESTHPGFAAAMRAAMPRLRFVPAEHRGRHVSQRVQKRFLFRIEVEDSVRT
jgi:TonB family protein